MISLIEVQCPHCGARGQLMLPPLGAIIVGPCPQCHEMVVIFCGRAFALNKEVMLHGEAEEKHEHLLAVLSDFLDERVADVVAEFETHAHRSVNEQDAETPEYEDETIAPVDAVCDGSGREAISSEEVQEFVSKDLKLLDNKDYFRAVFG